MTTFSGVLIGNNTYVQDIQLVMYGEHHELNATDNVCSVNLGKYSCFTKNGTLYIEDENELNKEIQRAIRAVMLTYLSKQSQKENSDDMV